MILKHWLGSILLSSVMMSHAIAEADYLNLSLQSGPSNTSITVSFNPGNSEIRWYDADTEQLVGQVQIYESSSRLTANGRMLYQINGLECGTEYDIQVQWLDEYYLDRGQHIKTKRCEIIEAPIKR